jgi:tetratricopeptide (TPR) repeat protein
MRRFFAFAVSLVLTSAPARAEWLEARTDHFVLKINETPEKARSFAERLERFDAALRKLYAVPDDPDQHLRPLAVYALDQKLFEATCRCGMVLGYYQPRVKQSAIFSMYVPQIDKKAKDGSFSSQVVLLHEYGHHFTYNNFPIAYPKWFSEGFAEFNATAQFDADGTVEIGFPANYRTEAIWTGGMTVSDLFDPDKAGIGFGNFDQFYGRGWLLTHYLMLNRGSRQGQLARYLDLVNHGKTSLEAARLAFGDLNALNAELNAYARKGLAPKLRVPLPAKAITVSIRQLSPGEAAILPTYAMTQTGTPKYWNRGVSLQAQQIARRYPTDPIVQSELAEIDLATDRLADALVAADAALKLNPRMVDPMVIKGLVALDVLFKSHSKDHPAWQSARAWFLNANHTDPNAVMPLYEYYASFVFEGVQPTDGAVKALMRAEVLAPESPNVRGLLARQMLMGGDTTSARALLAPLAYAPHAARAENMPLQLIQLIDAGKVAEAKELVITKEREEAAKAK